MSKNNPPVFGRPKANIKPSRVFDPRQRILADSPFDTLRRARLPTMLHKKPKHIGHGKPGDRPPVVPVYLTDENLNILTTELGVSLEIE